MPTLHGFSYSNYYNIAKHVLLHKGVDFQEDLVYPSAEGYDRLNPVRKVPSMTTDDGRHIAETAVLVEYLEEAYPDPALLPADPGERARVRQIMHASELYLELSCRRLLPFGFSGTEPPAALREEVSATVDRGVAAMNVLCTIDPWLTGERFTLADVWMRYVLSVVGMGEQALKRDITGEIEGLAAWKARMAEEPVSQRVDADQEANRESFFAYIKSMR